MTRRGVYRSLYSVLVDDPDFGALSPRARHVLLTMRASREVGIACLWLLEPATLARQTGYDLNEVESALDELCASPTPAAPWLYRDRPLAWLRNGLRYDPSINLANVNHRRGVVRAIASLPRSPLIAKFCHYYDLPNPFGGHQHGPPIPSPGHPDTIPIPSEDPPDATPRPSRSHPKPMAIQDSYSYSYSETETGTELRKTRSKRTVPRPPSEPADNRGTHTAPPPAPPPISDSEMALATESDPNSHGAAVPSPLRALLTRYADVSSPVPDPNAPPPHTMSAAARVAALKAAERNPQPAHDPPAADPPF